MNLNPAEIPDFLKGGADKSMGELSAMLGKLPTYFDTSEIEGDYNESIGTNTVIGRQSAGNAAREYSEREARSGGNGSLAGIIRGQGMLPFLQENTRLKSDLAGKKLQAKESEAQTAASIAGQMGELRMSYLNTLANYTSDITKLRESSRIEDARLAQQGQQFNAGLSLDREKLNLSREEMTANNRFKAAELASRVAQGGGSSSSGRNTFSRVDYSNAGIPGLPVRPQSDFWWNQGQTSNSMNNMSILQSIYRYL